MSSCQLGLDFAIPEDFRMVAMISAAKLADLRPRGEHLMRTPA
jgi:hypothetical protein